MFRISFKLFLILSGLVMLLLAGCEADNPDSIFNPRDTGKPAPQITQILPVDSTLAGVGLVTIQGSNFSQNPAENFVYFGKEKVQVVSATETEIKVKSPNTPANQLTIKIGKKDSYLFSNEIQYKLLRVYWELGGYDEYSDVYSIAIDKDDNLYTSQTTRKIERVTPDGVKSDYGTTSFLKADNMKMGPGGYLYLSRNTTALHRIAPGGGADQRWITATGRIFDFDFYEGGVIFAGGKNNDLIRIKPDGTAINITPYPDTNIKSVRVYNGYVYVGGEVNATAQNRVWRNKIISADQLEPSEVYFDFSANVDPIKKILCINFSADGDLYIGTDASAGIIIVHPDRSFEPLYPGVIEPTTYNMTWGKGNYLYANRRNDETPAKKKVLKINVLEPGAPNYGLQ